MRWVLRAIEIVCLGSVFLAVAAAYVLLGVILGWPDEMARG